MKTLEALVAEFARHAEAQTEALWKGDARTGNKHAKQCLAAFKKLAAQGDPGRDALASLFTHPRMDVRTMAAAFLLRHKTAEAKTACPGDGGALRPYVAGGMRIFGSGQDTDEHFRFLVESAREYAIFGLDTEGRVMSWNPGRTAPSSRPR